MTTKQLLSSMNYIQYPRFLGYYLGVNESILLAEFCDKDSWCELNIPDYDGWFYATRENIMIDTGLSDKEQRTALQNLSITNVIIFERRGIPAKMYYYINTDILSNIIDAAYNDYKERKIQMLPESTSCNVPSVTSRTDGKAIHTITKITKEEEIQTEHLQDFSNSNSDSTVKNSRRNFREKFKPLEDKLQSGKDIDAEKKLRKKTSEYEKCLDEIDKGSFTDNVKDLLRQHLDWSYHSNDPKRIKRLIGDYKSKLEYLIQRQSKGDDISKIVQQSIDRCWHAFYEYKGNTVNSQTSFEPLADKVIVTDEETRDREWAKKLESDEGWY